MGLWFSVFPTVETLLAQALAALLVIGSYFVASRRGTSHAQATQPAQLEAAELGSQTGRK
jgi:hypothetical protein